MIVSLPKSALEGLPAPDAEGIIRVRAALRMAMDGKVKLIEINDQPVGKDDDDDAPMPAEDLPDLDSIEEDIYKA